MSHPAPSSRLIDLLRARVPTLVLTGAGVSAESGLATFRGPGGLWEGRDPAELATPEAFAADPLTVWRFYDWRRRQAAAARPNPGHLALVALQDTVDDFLLVTQNVDGLHRRAGSRDVVELHGSLWTLRCMPEDRSFVDETPGFDDLPPRCACGALLRPGVVWFGEPLPYDALARAVAAARRARLVVVAGTSGLVYPAAGIPWAALEAGAYVVEINPERTPLSSAVNERLEGPSALVLPSLAELAGRSAGRVP